MAKKTAAVKKRPRTRMSDQHKAALAEGREQGRAVQRYLEALEQNRPKRGRKRTRERWSAGSRQSISGSWTQILSAASTSSRSAKTSRQSSPAWTATALT